MSPIASSRLKPHIEGLEILIPPFVVADFVRVVFVRKHGMVFEYMQYFEQHVVRRLTDAPRNAIATRG